jgi:hypothetical protein
MKFNLTLFILLFSTLVSAQNLSPEEQQKLIEENKALKEQLSKQGAASSIDPEQAKIIMEKLKQGQKLQLEQQKALEELNAE